MFGLQPDALQHTLRVTPQLPADWDNATVHNLHIGQDSFEVTFSRLHGAMQVDAVSKTPTMLCLTQSSNELPACKSALQIHHRLSISLPAVEAILPPESAREGSQTQGLKVLSQEAGDRSLTLVFDVPAGRSWSIKLRRNAAIKTLTITGAEATADGFVLSVPGQAVPSAESYTTATVHVGW
jgi:hypothetical protein